MFRYERPQKGRLRQFHQIGCEVLGECGPEADAEAVELGAAVLRELGLLEHTRLELNSLGDQESRRLYREMLSAHFSEAQARGGLSEESRRRMERGIPSPRSMPEEPIPTRTYTQGACSGSSTPNHNPNSNPNPNRERAPDPRLQITTGRRGLRITCPDPAVPFQLSSRCDVPRPLPLRLPSKTRGPRPPTRGTTPCGQRSRRPGSNSRRIRDW